jgi:hypothetical protein
LLCLPLSLACLHSSPLIELLIQSESIILVEIQLTGHVMICSRMTLNLRYVFYSGMGGVTTEWGDTDGNTRPPVRSIAFNVPSSGGETTDLSEA